MRLARFAPAAAALLLAACGSAPEDQIETTSTTRIEPVDSDVSTPELLNRSVKSSDLGVSRLKDPAKTVGYAGGSSELGERYLDGNLVLDRVGRQDADNLFCVTLGLFNNREDAASTFEWRILFYNDQGTECASLQPDWKSCSIDFKRWGSVSNAATVRGATRFRLQVRAAGSGAASTTP